MMSVKPGMRYRDFGKIIQDHAHANGFSVVRAFCGHGINQLFHCAPNVPHYASKSIQLQNKREMIYMFRCRQQSCWCFEARTRLYHRAYDL